MDDERYNPIRDEKKFYSMREFEFELKEAFAEYVRTFDGKNEFHSQPHTWSEWMNSFIGYMSW